MTTLARRHFARVMAAQQAAKVEQGAPMEGATQYELMLVKLAADRRRLKDVQSNERKAEVKREVLPEYADYVAGVLEGGRGAQDDVLVTVMVWRIDVGNFAGALAIARYALTHGLTMPDQFDRSLAVVLAEEIADAALAELQAGRPFSAELLAQAGELTDSHDMPDQVRAKLAKAYGYALITGEPLTRDTRWRYTAAINAFRRAQQLNARAGVKQVGDRTEKQLAEFDAAQGIASTTEQPNPAGGDNAADQ
ncbi:phage terminase small subunit [Cupriavidus sp. UGS-1]|uniref:phage terminase small subunit n=1 Tax=Cupriavidus sp. UGS-1 TaxID=2899826 RepID=UPI001E3C8F79|nr:phage terminase small subunit [Cupriavidus sp. UGS-1]MCD9124024.1 terminase [Cupriavidus sp. UGS-1]